MMKVTSMKIFLKMKDSCLKDLGHRHQMNIPRMTQSLVTRTRLWITQVCVISPQTCDETQIICDTQH